MSVHAARPGRSPCHPCSARARIPRADGGLPATPGARCRRGGISACNTSGARARRSPCFPEYARGMMRRRLSAWAPSVAYRERCRRRTPRDSRVTIALTLAHSPCLDTATSDSAFRHAASSGNADSGTFCATRCPHGWQFARCRCELTAPARQRLQYSGPRMKSDSLSITAMRASRLLAALACIASLGILACWAQTPSWIAEHAVVLPPPLAAVTLYVLGLAALLVGLAPLAARIGAQLLAVLAAGLALQAVVQTWSGIALGTDLVIFPEAVLRLHGAEFAHPGRMA